MQLIGQTKLVFFYDGSCGLCSRLVRVLHDHDRHHRLYFAPIGGQAFCAMAEIYSAVDTGYDSSYFFDGTSLLNRSDAVLVAMQKVEGWPRIVGWMAHNLVPRLLKNLMYDRIAKRRQWFSARFFAPSCTRPASSLLQHTLP